MASLTCPRCFKTREEAKSQPIPDIRICGGCAMDVDAVLGFLRFNNYQMQMVMVVDEETGELKLAGHLVEPPEAQKKEQTPTPSKTQDEVVRGQIVPRHHTDPEV